MYGMLYEVGATSVNTTLRSRSQLHSISTISIRCWMRREKSQPLGGGNQAIARGVAQGLLLIVGLEYGLC